MIARLPLPSPSKTRPYAFLDCILKTSTNIQTRITLLSEKISAVASMVLLGLHYLHSNLKIHRDVKAGNILVNRLALRCVISYVYFIFLSVFHSKSWDAYIDGKISEGVLNVLIDFFKYKLPFLQIWCLQAGWFWCCNAAVQFCFSSEDMYWVHFSVLPQRFFTFTFTFLLNFYLFLLLLLRLFLFYFCFYICFIKQSVFVCIFGVDRLSGWRQKFWPATPRTIVKRIYGIKTVALGNKGI